MTRPPRKAIPLKVKVQVNLRQLGRCAECGLHMNDGVEYDHRPPIILRPINAKGSDYEPRQLDPEYIEALHPECHQKRTTGRKPGATKTATTLGSDIHLKTKFARLERKARTTIKPKGFGGTRKIASRPFSTQKRTFR